MREESAQLQGTERLDDLQRGGYYLIQDEKLFCFGMDSVLLSAFARALPGEQVLDLGCGNGVIPILMKARYPEGRYSGLELNARSVSLARRSVALNGLEASISIIQGDIKEADRIYPAASFDVITGNPPYMTGGHGLTGADEEVAAARHEIWCTLEDVVRAASNLLKSKGRFYLVHRPFRLAEIMICMRNYHLEPKRMRLVYPYADREPNMVLLEGVKGGRPRITVEPPLIVYEKPGVYTEEIRQIYYG